MNFWKGIMSNEIIIITFIAWFVAQLLKVIFVLIQEKKFDLTRFVGSGGMPSSHTSTVMGLSTAIGLKAGWDSSEYAIALTFALIVMYDASGVRRSVGKQAKILNQILEDFKHNKLKPEKQLKELVGHTPKQVLAGAILGIAIANIFIKYVFV